MVVSTQSTSLLRPPKAATTTHHRPTTLLRTTTQISLPEVIGPRLHKDHRHRDSNSAVTPRRAIMTTTKAKASGDPLPTALSTNREPITIQGTLLSRAPTTLEDQATIPQHTTSNPKATTTCLLRSRGLRTRKAARARGRNAISNGGVMTFASQKFASVGMYILSVVWSMSAHSCNLGIWWLGIWDLRLN